MPCPTAFTRRLCKESVFVYDEQEVFIEVRAEKRGLDPLVTQWIQKLDAQKGEARDRDRAWERVELSESDVVFVQ